MARVHISVFAGVLVLFGAVLLPVEGGGAKKAITACMQQTGATGGDLEKFMKNGEASQQLKCMFSCTLQAIKFMKADGSFDESYIKSSLPSSVGSLVDTCLGKAQPESDVCQRAYVYLHCFSTAQPQIFIQFTTTD